MDRFGFVVTDSLSRINSISTNNSLEFQEQPLVWACSKLEAFWTAVRPVKQNEALMAVKFLSE